MIEDAIKKIREEMEKSKTPYIQAIGNYLLKQIEINKDAAEKIVAGEKTIEKSLKEVEKVARTKVVQGCAVLEDKEVFAIVSQYYGFEAEQPNMTVVVNEEVKPPVSKEPKNKNFNVDLNSLLKR